MKFFYLFICVLLRISLSAQTDFLPSNKFVKWTGATGAYNGQGHTNYYWTQFEIDTINNDTIINNLVYTKLNYKFDSDISIYYCSFRSDTINQKLYFIPKDSSFEYLFFDYGANYELGDTALIPHYHTLYHTDYELPINIKHYKLNQIDSVQIDNNYYINYGFYLIDSTDENTTEQYTGSEFISISERLISNTAFPFHGDMNNYFYETHHLGCYQENDILKYNNSHFNVSCPLTPDSYLFSSIEVKNLSDLVSIYPNPNKGNININLTENANLKILDLNGKILLNKNLNFGLNKLDFSRHDKGVYILEFKTKSQIIHKKIIIE